MTDAAVRRLTLHLPRTASRSQARARIEDALRCGPDPQRLLLVRDLALGVLPLRSGQAAWSTRIHAALRRIDGRAVHGLAADAERADCVFFADALEARAALLWLLVAGRRADAWFWRLAAPEWDGSDWPHPGARLLLALVACEGGAVALARTVTRLLAAGQLSRLERALTPALAVALQPALAARAAAVPTLLALAQARPAAVRRADAPATTPSERRPASEAAEAAAAVAASQVEEAAAVALASRVIEALPPTTRLDLLRRLAEPDASASVTLWLAAQLIMAAAPHALAAPASLAAAARALRLALAMPRPTLEPAAAKPGLPTAAPVRAPAARHRGSPPTRTTPAIPATPNDPAEPTTPHGQPDALVALEERSAAAGLLLVIRPLILLGLPEWLQRRPDLALEGFGWSLLAHIAERMRLSPADPVWCLLPPPAAPNPWHIAWRVGLDRWLRRRADVRLAELVGRTGWVRLDEGRTVVRFRLGDADLRLRRLALDVDPGWVPWLGHAVRYVYDDQPLGRGA